jgi:hypothetical protein
MSGNEVFIILGMHKSGTTLVSNMLHHSNVPMVEQESDKAYREGNKYERSSTNKFNKELLAAGNTKSIFLRTRLDIDAMKPEQYVAAKKLVSQIEAEAGGDWGFKDPRTCLTYDFWKTVLPRHKAICVIRDPKKVHDHYAGWKLFGFRDGINALLAWHTYNELILEYVKELPLDRSIVVDYGMLVSKETEFSRLEKFVGRKLVDRRNNQRRRKTLDFGVTYAVNLFVVEFMLGKKIRKLYSDVLALRDR